MIEIVNDEIIFYSNMKFLPSLYSFFFHLSCIYNLDFKLFLQELSKIKFWLNGFPTNVRKCVCFICHQSLKWWVTLIINVSFDDIGH